MGCYEDQQGQVSVDPAQRRRPAQQQGAREKSTGGNINRAATLLRSAASLEKASNKAGALTFYRQIVTDFPASAEAKTAQERISALEDK
jgi:hypothetical protein